MAKRNSAAKKQTEDQMESNEPLDPEVGDPVDQPGDEPQQEPGQPNDDPPTEATQPGPARDFEAEETALKLQMQELRKQKKEAKKGQPKTPKVAKEKAPRAPKDEANGVTRPSMGVTKEVWDTADMLSKKLGTYVDRSTLTEVLNGKVEIGTIHTQYGRWRKYYGLTETRDQRAERMAQIRAKKLADIGVAQEQPQAEAQGEQQAAETQ
jgi:hypothetical protein